ncbi:hypothetical protein KKG72_07965 [bacterium]|nr:hypothetical protein [bacterium]MBU1994570.1 hypothetical protein [bacterium]
MNKKSNYTQKTRTLGFIFLTLLTGVVLQGLYLSSQKGINTKMLEKKMAFVALSGLPDLAISTEATYIRHRSLSDIFSIYKDDGSLREYFPSTYTISHSHIINK